MQRTSPGAAHLALALGTVGLGTLCLGYGSFVPQWQPVPPGFPWQRGLAYASGAVLVAGGIGLCVPRLAWRAALALTVYQSIWVAATARGIAPNLASLGRWLGFCEGLGEALTAMLGCYTLGALLGADGAPRRLAFMGGRRSRRAVRVLFGACCLAFGLAHFAFADFTATMIPPWLPARTGLVYLTGACHVAAALALVTTVLARLAATLEAVMLGAFVLLVHLPGFATSPAWAPSRQVQWTELCLGVLLAGAAGVVADSLGDRPWGVRRRA